MKISIIIPTYNRLPILKMALMALVAQNFPRIDFEIIIVDDGSTDNTKEIMPKFIKQLPINISYLRQNNKGPGAARNYGVKKAKGKLIIFIGDDIIVAPDFIKEHLKIHKRTKDKIAVLGFTDWYPKLHITEFMRFLAPNGPQFDYSDIEDPNNCNYGKFWTSNISLEKSWFDKVQFREDSPFAAYEDTLYAYQLFKNGLSRIVFNKKALAYHDHKYDDIEKFFTRQRNAGKAARILIWSFKPLRKLVYKKVFAFLMYFILSNLTFWGRKNYIFRRTYWQYKLRLNYFIGFFS